MSSDPTLIQWPHVEVPELLPEGWEEVRHQCGMTFYFHKPTNTVTWTRPYVKGGTSKVEELPSLLTRPQEHQPSLSIFQNILDGKERELKEHYNQRFDMGLWKKVNSEFGP
jgi:hypothetical protein